MLYTLEVINSIDGDEKQLMFFKQGTLSPFLSFPHFFSFKFWANDIYQK